MGLRRDRATALAILERVGYDPFPWQRRFHAATAPAGVRSQKLAICGLGAGKTHLFVEEAAVLAMLNPGCWGVISAPTYDQLTNVILPRWQAVCEAMSAGGYPLSKKYHKTSSIDELWCGGRVFFRSMSKIDNLRSFEFAWAGMDEIEIMLHSADIWNTVAGRVRQNANVSEVFGTSTPRGLRGVVELFAQNRDIYRDTATERLREWFWIRATSFDNPELPDGYLDSLRHTYSTRRWNEEVLAQILRPESGVWSADVDPARHVAAGWKFTPGQPYDLACDWGDQYPHVLWIARGADGTCTVFDEFCDDGMPPGKLHDMVTSRCRALGSAPEHAVGDRAVPTEMAWLQQAFPRTQVHRMRTREQQSVSAGIELVRDRLDPMGRAPLLYVAERLVPSRARRGIWNCLRNYRYRTSAAGGVTTDPQKDGIHDHGADALRMHQVALFGGANSAFYTFDRRW